MFAQLSTVDTSSTVHPATLTRERNLAQLAHRAEQRFSQELIDRGLINRCAGSEGYTEFHQRYEDVLSANALRQMFLESQVKKLVRQLESVLACDALTDPDLRREVLGTVNRHRDGDRRLTDAQLLSRDEQEFIDGYRRLATPDRALLRGLTKRLTVNADAVEGGVR